MAYWRTKGAPWLGSYTFANLTTTFPAASFSGYTAFASDLGTNGSYVISNGTRWRAVNGTAVLKNLGSTSGLTAIANSETIVLQTLLPVNAWQQYDKIRVWVDLTKSGTTDSCLCSIRAGTAGTTGDTALMSGVGIIGAAGRTFGQFLDFRLETATTAQKLGTETANAGSYSGQSASATTSPVTITSAAANALYISLSIYSSSTNNTVGIQDGRIELLTA